MGLLILVSSPEIAPYDLRHLTRFFFQSCSIGSWRRDALKLWFLGFWSLSHPGYRLKTQIGVSDSENPEKMGAGSGVLQIYQYLGDSCEFMSLVFFKNL